MLNKFYFNGIKKDAVVSLPASKSESNRMLILQALSKEKITLKNISNANDTLVLHNAIHSNNQVIDIEDAGTAMRFLTAYFALKNEQKTITGSKRMCERPIGILVAALNEIGFDIRYKKNDGYPPIEIHPVDLTKLKSTVTIAGNISSQYISALLLIAPFLPNGLTINFSTAITSLPYIHLTIHSLAQIGINIQFSKDKIIILPQSPVAANVTIESDWSAASYFFAICALVPNSVLLLQNLHLTDKQGDTAIANYAENFGVFSSQTNDGLIIKNMQSAIFEKTKFDLADTPDLAQTLIPLCAILNFPAIFTGLKTLRIKETDRIAALQNELKQFNIELMAIDDDAYQLNGKFSIPNKPIIQTYSDHRMAMGFAPYAFRFPIEIENPKVVKKSFPNFWKELSKLSKETK